MKELDAFLEHIEKHGLLSEAQLSAMRADVCRVAHSGTAWKAAHDLAASERDALRAELTACKAHAEAMAKALENYDMAAAGYEGQLYGKVRDALAHYRAARTQEAEA